MVGLSPEEKKRISLEEKERVEAQETIKTQMAEEKNLKQKKDLKTMGVGCLVFLIVAVVYMIFKS